MAKYAFFDVDQTIYPGYSIADFYHTPSISNLISPDFYQRDLAIGQLYKSGQITYAEAGLRAAKLCATSVKGLSVNAVSKLANEFISTKGVRDFVSTLFTHLQQSGYTIILVSGSLDFIIKAIAHHTKADRYHATTPQLSPKSTYTGNITHQLDDVEKAKLIRSNYDLSQSSVLAFGDSTGDIPMLSLADHAFIINPHQTELHTLITHHANYHLVDDSNIVTTVKNYAK